MAPSGLMSADPSGSSSRQDEPTGDVGARSCSSQDRVTGTALPLTITMSISSLSTMAVQESGWGLGGESGGKRGWGWEHGECTLATSKHLRVLGEHHGRARAGQKGSQAELRGFTQKRVGI